MPSFLTIGGRPGARTKRHGGGVISSQGMPYTILQVWDDSGGGIPASPTSAPTGRLLLQIDLTAATFSGTPLTLANTITGTTLLIGFPLYVRFTTLDGLTATDTPYILPPNSVTPTQEVDANDPPDSSFIKYPGPWLDGTTVSFGPGDLVYQP